MQAAEATVTSREGKCESPWDRMEPPLSSTSWWMQAAVLLSLVHNDRPANMDITLSYAAPELIMGMAGGCPGLRCKHLMVARAQDVFSLGCFAVLQLTGKALFSSKATDTDGRAADLCWQHLQWEAT
ncbi:hypothetical protein ABBQ38_008831 [Trebouxia sp. C0009 RCD-2024]